MHSRKHGCTQHRPPAVCFACQGHVMQVDQHASCVPPAGNLTLSAAACRSEGCCTSMLRGVGRPAAAILARVLCLSRAASTASGELPDRPRASAILDTSGTAISQNVHTPSNSPKSCQKAKDLNAAQIKRQYAILHFSRHVPFDNFQIGCETKC